MSNKTRISLLILLILGLHAVPVLSYQGERSFPPGPIEVATRRIVATYASGNEEEVTQRLVGLPTPAFKKTYIVPLWKGDSAPAYELIERLNRGRSDPVVQLRLEGQRQALVDTGVVREALPVVTYRAQPPATR
jgi:hypothetical protein